jgi:hypothetical protein
MIKLKAKPQPQKEVSAEASLADRIKETCAAAEQYIESRVQQEKAGSGASFASLVAPPKYLCRT